MKRYDLRSDTVTKPTPGMRKAIYEAEVGDDVQYEDPTVNRLEAMSAERLGKEAALFVPSGSMGNLIPLFLNAGRGTEVLAHQNSHIIHHEVGAVATVAGVTPIGIDTPRGLLTAEAVKPHIKPIAFDLARSAMIEVENTMAGIHYDLPELEKIKKLAEAHGLVVHMDGARFWNAAVATRTAPEKIAAQADTITFCISKGLGAPAGSLICGTKAFIAKARTIRKMLGGGMRQVGILAAAGVYALEHHIDRLADDHAHAKQVAACLAATGWARVCLEDVETNIMLFSVDGVPNKQVLDVLASKGILALEDYGKIRLVTNLDLSSEDISEVCRIIESIDVREFTA